jgi:carbonic anhydrase
VRILAAVVLLSATTFAAQSTCPPSPDYSYRGPHGPAHWVEQWPLCGQGKAQSPIDIPSAGSPAKGPAIEFHYQPFDPVIENTSHVIEVDVAKGSYIMVDGHRSDLIQFHFHTPSEHRMAGRASSLEVHFVHKDAAGKITVVGVLTSGTAVNPALQPLVAALPVSSCANREPHAKFDAAALLPATRDYVTYGGSLTTPGCGENVTWLVLTTPIPASAAQVAKLGPFGVNARPVQPLNGRPIVHVAGGK